MGLEIERKYLLDGASIVDALISEGLEFSEKNLTQIYTQIDKEHEIRLRKMGNTYTRTTKKGKGLVREEDEEVVDSKLFKLAKKSCIGKPIEKTRYLFKLQNFPSCIDVYSGELDGLVTLEVEFDSIEKAEDFKLPLIVKERLLREVTDDDRFKNKNLSLIGNPSLLSRENVCDVIVRLDKIENGTTLELDLPGGIDSGDAMRIVFYQLMQKIIFHKDSFLENGENEDLHQFRVNIRKTRSLLQCMPDLFDVDITQRFIDDFKTIASSTNEKRDLDVFGEYLASLDDLEVTFLIAQIREERKKEDEIISLMMQSELFEKIMHSWSVVLKDDDNFYIGESFKRPIKITVAHALIARLNKMKKKLLALEEHVNVEKFHSVRIEFKRLRYMLEYFAPYFHSEIFDDTMSVAKKMQTVFGELQDRDVQYEILESLALRDEWCSDVQIIKSLENLKEEIRNDIYQLRTKILMRKPKLVEKLSSCIDTLNIYAL